VRLGHLFAWQLLIHEYMPHHSHNRQVIHSYEMRLACYERDDIYFRCI